MDFYVRGNKKIHLVLENWRRNPSEIQQLHRVKNVLNKEVEAEKEGKDSGLNEKVKHFNKYHEKGKHFTVNDIPDYLAEEAGIKNNKKKKERSLQAVYNSEEVQDYMGHCDIDDIIKKIDEEKPKPKTSNKKAMKEDYNTKEESIPRDSSVEYCANKDKNSVKEELDDNNNSNDMETMNIQEENGPDYVKEENGPDYVKDKLLCDNPGCQFKGRHRCSGCLQVSYCSKQCSIDFWPIHQLQCIKIPRKLRKSSQRKFSLSEVD